MPLRRTGGVHRSRDRTVPLEAKFKLTHYRAIGPLARVRRIWCVVRRKKPRSAVLVRGEGGSSIVMRVGRAERCAFDYVMKGGRYAAERRPCAGCVRVRITHYTH